MEQRLEDAGELELTNRARLHITPGGPWRLYTHAIHGMQMLGTVQRGMEIGALARTQAGLLVQVNAGAVRMLDQRRASAALAAGDSVSPDAA